MAEHWAFLNRLRLDLGKGYTTAEEHSADGARVHILVLHTRSSAVLTIDVDVRWLALQTHPDAPVDRIEYKHLTTNVRSFFARPQNLPAAAFAWPADRAYREDVRRTLSRRQQSLSLASLDRDKGHEEGVSDAIPPSTVVELNK